MYLSPGTLDSFNFSLQLYVLGLVAFLGSVSNDAHGYL